MPTPEQFIEEFLEHADRVYDAQRAHDYYLRTRRLKGRQAGQQETTSGRGGRTAPKLATRHPGGTRHQQAKEQLAALQHRLERLREALDVLLKEAKGRSGIKTPVKKSPAKAAADSKSGGGSKEKLTAKQKREAAKRSADYRKKHPEKSTVSPEAKSVEQKIKDVRETIRKVKEDIAKAMEAAQRKTATKAVNH